MRVFNFNRAERVGKAGEGGAQRPASVCERRVVTRGELEPARAVTCGHGRGARLVTIRVEHGDVEIIIAT
jgi:hypothetical protein